MLSENINTNVNFFDIKLSFTKFCNQAVRGCIINLLIQKTENYNVDLNQAIRNVFNKETYLDPSGFYFFLNHYIYLCYKDYILFEEKIKKNEEIGNIDSYAYIEFNKMFSQYNSKKENGGYKHLNCLLNGILKYCIFIYIYLVQYFSKEMPIIEGFNNKGNNKNGISETKLILLRTILDTIIQKGNEDFEKLQNKPHNLKCKVDDSCKQNVEKENFYQEFKIFENTHNHNSDNDNYDDDYNDEYISSDTDEEGNIRKDRVVGKKYHSYSKGITYTYDGKIE